MKRYCSCFAAISFAFCVISVVHAAPSSTPAGPAPSRSDRRDDRVFAPQSTVAAKGTFAEVGSTDPAVKCALNAKDLSGARKLVGKDGAFTGTVSKVYSPDDHDIVILDFDPNYRSALTAVVRPDAYKNLPSLDAVEGKRVLVTGKFIAYRGKPEIQISGKAQVKVIN